MQFTAELSMDNFSEDGGDNSTQFSSGLQTHHDNSVEEHSTFSFEEKQYFVLNWGVQVYNVKFPSN